MLPREMNQAQLTASPRRNMAYACARGVIVSWTLRCQIGVLKVLALLASELGGGEVKNRVVGGVGGEFFSLAGRSLLSFSF